MGDVSKNISKGGEIGYDKLIELYQQRKSVVLVNKGSHSFAFVRPAAFIINWPLIQILRYKIHYAIHDDEIIKVEFEKE